MNFDEIAQQINEYPNSLVDIEDIGYRFVGDGAYANVFVSNSGDHVVKIFRYDRAYMKWLNFCYKNQHNPYVPKLMSNVYKLVDDYYAVFMEVLKTDYDKIYENDLWKCVVLSKDPKDEFQSVLYNEISSNSHLEDLHSGNILFRGETAVVTDPYCGDVMYEALDNTYIVEV